MSTVINCKLRTLSPFHTGSDHKDGNVMSLRKEDIVSYENNKKQTPFATEIDLNNSVLQLLYVYYKSMNSDFKSGANSYGGYNLFFAFVRKALSNSNSWIEFQSKILEYIGAENIIKWFRDAGKETMKLLDFDVFKNVFKKNQKYLRVELQYHIQNENELSKAAEVYNDSLEFCEYNTVATGGYVVNIRSTEVPVITGNSIIGKIRRVVFDNFIDLLQIKREDLKNQLILELLIQGGRNLHKTGKPDKGLIPFVKGSISDFYYTSEGVVNIVNRIEMERMLPFLALLGYSFGNQTGESLLASTYGRLQCIENNNGDLHSTDLVDVMFYTHKDEIKNFSHEFVNAPEGTAQMKYDVEVVKTNAKFETTFTLNLPKNLNTDEKIIESCFFWILKIFKENCKLGARNNRGEGSFDVVFDVETTGKEQLFLEHIENNKEKIKKYLQIGDLTVSKFVESGKKSKKQDVEEAEDDAIFGENKLF